MHEYFKKVGLIKLGSQYYYVRYGQIVVGRFVGAKLAKKVDMTQEKMLPVH